MNFTDFVDLAAEELGGAVLLANDEFFAEKENLLKGAAAEWREHDYTPRGKWMDGWETRRRRDPGFDWAVIRLGLPGIIRGVVVDTAYFRGNYPAECSLEACSIDATLDLDALAGAQWIEILPRSALKGDSRNEFAVRSEARFTHVRLNIYPDGGVARLRVHGEVKPDLRRLQGLIDLAALENGGRSLVCSDMFFGSRNNLLLPGRPANMSSGWETRRRRGPGHDWNLVQLGLRGVIRRVELDTTHFKGNAPGRCMIEAQDGEAGEFRVLLPETRTQPHTRHFFEGELRNLGAVTHLRLNVYPDGGVARLRAWGEPEIDDPRSAAVTRLNVVSTAEAAEIFMSFCASKRWAEDMAEQVPFEDAAALSRIADRYFWQLDERDWLEAFAAHPRIGAQGGSAWSKQEQSGVQDEQRARFQTLNDQYFEKFGFVFLICATGRTGAEMLLELQRRLENDRHREIRTAAEEQAKILQLRIARWLEGK